MEEPVKIFKYDQLQQADAIRLLTLHSGPPGSTLRCTLTYTTLAECRHDIHGRYTALSYVWGDPDDRRTIFVDDQPCTVTAILASALDGLRDESRHIRVWADAICIDQLNIPERNKQVSLMREIYSIAQQTIIYLGEADERCHETFRNLGAIGNPPNTEKATVAESVRTLAMDHILSRPWFSRVWIYQELILSREVWVQMGRERVTWDEFCVGLLGRHDDLQSESDSHVTRIPPKRIDKGWEILSNMRASRHKYMLSLLNNTDPPSLLNILTTRRGLGVSDLRDMIYAHLGVTGCFDHSAKRCEDFGLLIVDYNKTISEVFVDATLHIIASWQGSRVLLEAELFGQKRRVDGLPSWVPDWSLGNRNHEHSGPIPPRRLSVNLADSWGYNKDHFDTYCCLPGSGIFAFRSPKVMTVQATSDVVLSSTGLVESRICAAMKRRFLELQSETLPLPYPTQQRLFCETYQEWCQFLGEDIISPPWDAFDVQYGGWRGMGPSWGLAWVSERKRNANTDWDVKDQNGQNLLDILMNYSFGESRKFLDGRKVARLVARPPEEHLAVVPAETLPGDVIHALVFGNKIRCIVLRPLMEEELWETEDKVILEKIPHTEMPPHFIHDSVHRVKHFRFIGTAWIEYISVRKLRLRYIVALH